MRRPWEMFGNFAVSAFRYFEISGVATATRSPGIPVNQTTSTS